MRIRRRRTAVRLLLLEPVETRVLLSVLTVTSTIDGASGSLRAEIGQASSGDLIRFSPRLRGAQLALTQGELVIDKSLTIQGSGQKLDAGGQSRVLEVKGPHVNATLSRLTITGGKAELDPTQGYVGGGIVVRNAALTLQSCVITRNLAQGLPGTSPFQASAYPAEGGGLYAFESRVTLVQTTISSNQALGGTNTLDEQSGQAGGGGLFFLDSTVQITGGKLQGNLAQGGDSSNPFEAFPTSDGGTGSGGAMLLLASDASLSRVQVVGNLAVGGKGLDGVNAHSSLPGNGPGLGGTATGGAFFMQGTGDPGTTSTLSLSNVRLSNNTARGGPAGTALNNTQPATQGGAAVGGAIEQQTGTTLLLKNTQFIGSQAIGGPAALNVPDAGTNTSTGGMATGGAIDSEFFTQVSGANVQFLNNVARGAPGGDSAPDIGTEAGEGGFATGGAWNLTDTGGLIPSPPLPVTLQNVVFQNNQALAGPSGAGPYPTDVQGGGGIATGGAMETNGIFNLQLTRTQWLNNRAISQQGKFAFGGALGMANGLDTNQTMIQRSTFRGNVARAGDDPQFPDYAVAQGGAILNNNPNMTIVQSQFLNNTAQGGNATGQGVPGYAKGGAILSSGIFGSSLTLAEDRFIGNRALAGAGQAIPSLADQHSGYAQGGVIFLENGSLNISTSQFARNLAQGNDSGTTHDADGGALYLMRGTTTELSTSVFQGNQAIALGANTARGGAIANFTHSLDVSTSAFLKNQALIQGSGKAYGGGMYLAIDPTISLSSITGNAALARGSAGGSGGQGFGGGIAFAGNPRVILTKVSIRRNRATTAGPDTYGDHRGS